MKLLAIIGSVCLSGLFAVNSLAARSLITPQTIETQKALTHIAKLDKGLPLVSRQSDGSDIVQIELSFRFGLKDTQGLDKVASDLLFATMSKAAKNWPKAKIFKHLEAYSASISCSMGIESSSCQMTSISRYWTKILPIFEAIIEQPTFSPADLKLARLNQETQLKSKTEDPSYYANEMLNTIFYGKQHPYFMPTATQLKLLPQVKRSHIRKLHSQLVKQIDAITIVSSLPTDEIHKRLNRHFGDIQPAKIVAPKVPKPGQGDRKDFIFAHRKIPTAYIRIKFPMPGVHAEDFQAANLMTSILDEELSLEIRTKRSLSYAVFSYMIKYSQGIGVIGASTSKPQQTIAAISQVIKRIKQKKYTEDELAKFKTVYTTSYFLKLEDHGSLASTISRYWFYDQSTDPLYESPLGLAAVSSQEVQTMAQRYLANFKMAVVFDKTRFETDWAQTFLKEHKTSAH